MRETGRPYLSIRFSYTCEISFLKKTRLEPISQHIKMSQCNVEDLNKTYILRVIKISKVIDITFDIFILLWNKATTKIDL